MKKTKIFSALALASCVMLSGCKTKEKPEEPAIPDPSMVVDGLPQKVHVGDSVNLDSYVSLTSLSSFSVEIAEESADLVSIEGHTVTVLGEGEIKFTVKAGELSKDCSIVSIYEIRDQLIEYFKNVGRNYTVTVYEPEYDEQDEPTGNLLLADVLSHTENYIYSLSSWSSTASGGFLRFGEDDPDAYQFNVPFPAEEEGGETEPSSREETAPLEEEEEIELGKMISPSLFNTYNNTFDYGVDFSDPEVAVVEVDAETGDEYLYLRGEDAEYFAENSLFGADFYNSQGQVIATYNEIEFYMENIANEGEKEEYVACANTYVEYQEQTLFESLCEFYVDEEAVGVEFLDAYCVPENKPAYEEFKYWDGIGLTDYFLSDTSKAFGGAGVINVMAGWYDSKGNAVTEGLDEIFFGVGDQLPALQKTYYTSETSIYEVEKDEESPLGIKAVSGRTTVVNEESGEKEIYDVLLGADGKYSRELDSESTSVWDALELFPGLREESAWKDGAIGSISNNIEIVHAEQLPDRVTRGDEPVDPVDPEPTPEPEPEPSYLPEMPSVDVATFLYNGSGEVLPVPAYAGASEELGFELDDSYPGYLDVYVYNSTAEEMDAYKDALVAAGWVVVGQSEDGDYRLQFPELTAVVDLINFGDYIDLSFTVVTPAHQISVNSWHARAILDSVYAGIEGMDVLKEVVDWYYEVSGGDNLEEFLNIALTINESGRTMLMISLSWDADHIYNIGIMYAAVSSAANICAYFDSNTVPTPEEPEAQE